MELAPVLLFTYNRLDQTTRTIDALKRNFLAKESELFIFSDGSKNDANAIKVSSVRHYIKSISGFKKVTIFEAAENKGLANSIIAGVTMLINQYDKVIVLEDDLITSRNFLSFCNQALHYYKDNQTVFSIGGYSGNIKGLNANEVYFTRRATSWGWAAWKDQWNRVDWGVRDYNSFKSDRAAKKQFNEMGSDMSGMLDKQMKGEINSWAIRWCYHQFKNDLLTVFPAKSKVTNIGFTEAASHTTGRFNSFGVELDDSENTIFAFSDEVRLKKDIVRQFIKPYSISERIKNKVLNFVNVRLSLVRP